MIYGDDIIDWFSSIDSIMNEGAVSIFVATCAVATAAADWAAAVASA